MKISYVAAIRLPTEKAHGYQIMRVCSELAQLGNEVTLYVPDRANPISDDPFSYYSLPPTFSIVRVPCFDALRFGRWLGPLAFWLTIRSFLRVLVLPKDAVVYTRDHEAVAFLSNGGSKCIYNAHNWEEGRKFRVHKAIGVVCNSRGTETALKSALDLPTVVVPNATDPNPYVGQKEAMRTELGLSHTTQIALYAGHLYGWKGKDVLVEAATLLPSVQFVVIGGTMDRHLPNLSFLGFKVKSEVPKYLVAADVLLLPNTMEGESRFTSPLKMFEYMASGTPIVASDISSIREVLSDDTTLLVESNSATALVQGVEETFAKSELSKERAQKALTTSTRYTWTAHAQKVAEFILTVYKPTTS